MDRVCPEAWMLNLTNPMTVLTRIVGMVSGIKVVGLCHELMGVRGALMRLFGGKVEDYEVRVAGVNHLIWLLDLKIRGEDGFLKLREHLSSGGRPPVLPDQGNWHDNFLDRWQVKMQLFDLYGALPAAGDRHLAEFFPYFLTPENDYGAEVGVGLTTIPNRKDQVAGAGQRVRQAIEGELPPLERSHEATADIVSAVANGKYVRTIVNLPNTGQIENLPRGAVVETLAELGAAGRVPLTVGTLPLGVLSTLMPHVINQELIAQAALEGNYQLALQAMVNDPLVGDLKVAKAMLDELIEAHAQYLPQFKKRVAVAA
jgi:alpha-galactosidase/6-phospho-beta-glucosidase family protein